MRVIKNTEDNTAILSQAFGGYTRQISPRIESIDLLRGLVMVIMALDHVRDYFHRDAFFFDPTDLSQTTAPLFFTRWITHFCAPVFVFLTGISAYLNGTKKTPRQLSAFLLKRGLWLVFLELTVVNFAWFFNIHFTIIPLIVIWALGVSMIALAGLIHLPKRVILGFGLVLVLGHNLLDSIQLTGSGFYQIVWSILHQQRILELENGRLLFMFYPLIPWVGVMALGYSLGEVYATGFNPEQRKRLLSSVGIICISLFLALRFTNLYGDSHLWTHVNSSATLSLLSFLNTTKYPPSLLYLLMMIGPALLFLAYSEGIQNGVARRLITFGKVPMFYYLIHLYLIHFLALPAAVLTGYSAKDMVLDTWITMSKPLKGYGFNLLTVYTIWLLVIACLYPACRWYEHYKSSNRDKWWVTYL